MRSPAKRRLVVEDGKDRAIRRLTPEPTARAQGAGSPRQLKGARKAPCPASSSRAGDAGRKAARRRSLAARDQVRRLPAAGADRGRPGEAADPQRPRLDGEVRQGRSPRRFKALPVGTRPDRRRAGGRERSTAPRISRCCRPTSAKAASTASSTTPSICMLSRRLRSARDAAGRAQGAARARCSTGERRRCATASISSRTAS